MGEGAHGQRWRKATQQLPCTRRSSGCSNQGTEAFSLFSGVCFLPQKAGLQDVVYLNVF